MARHGRREGKASALSAGVAVPRRQTQPQAPSRPKLNVNKARHSWSPAQVWQRRSQDAARQEPLRKPCPPLPTLTVAQALSSRMFKRRIGGDNDNGDRRRASSDVLFFASTSRSASPPVSSGAGSGHLRRARGAQAVWANMRTVPLQKCDLINDPTTRAAFIALNRKHNDAGIIANVLRDRLFESKMIKSDSKTH